MQHTTSISSESHSDVAEPDNGHAEHEIAGVAAAAQAPDVDDSSSSLSDSTAPSHLLIQYDDGEMAHAMLSDKLRRRMLVRAGIPFPTIPGLHMPMQLRWRSEQHQLMMLREWPFRPRQN